ncbi:hypothetical protein [Streptomyces sp. KR55]|uniref:hypothetical protein n=1 Tax=Streptomyces sp. KR55 TaxID=3457425 RepID=UPI003FD6A3BD
MGDGTTGGARVAISDGVRRWWDSAAARALVFVLCAAFVFHALVLFAEVNSADDTFVGGAFRLWAAMVAFSVTVWIALFGRGITTTRALSRSWPCGRGWWTASIVSYAVLMAAATVTLRGITSGNSYEVPIHHAPALMSVLTLVGTCAGAPWALAVWLAQERLRKAGVPQRPEDPESSASPEDLEDGAAAVRDVLAVWKVVESSGLALALIVSTSVFNTGALRVSLINSGAVEPSDFPPLLVLGYGAFFAAVLAAMLLPPLLTWRARAFSLIDRAVPAPASGLLDEAQLAERARMEAQLHVDAPLFRNPITALSVLSPLATALLTALVPNGA